MTFSTLCIFTHSGHTFTFKDVEILCDNETVIKFGYQAMSDGLTKVGIFPKATICGWSLTPSKPKKHN
jgi:hypothetical protein